MTLTSPVSPISTSKTLDQEVDGLLTTLEAIFSEE